MREEKRSATTQTGVAPISGDQLGEQTFEHCRDMMLLLDRLVQPGLPDRSNPEHEPHFGVDLRSEFAFGGLGDILRSDYRELGLQRIRCYVADPRSRDAFTNSWQLLPWSKKSIEVRTFDVLLPTWNGVLMVNPTDLWHGDRALWGGFRPATGPSPVQIIQAKGWPISDLDGILDRSMDFEPGKPYYWAENDPTQWRVQLQPDPDISRIFMHETKDLVDSVMAMFQADVQKPKQRIDATHVATNSAPARQLG